MTFALKLVISCETLGVMKSFQGSYFAHAFSKALNIQLLKKEYLGVLNMFPLYFPKKNCRYVLHGLKIKEAK
jgi:hypothetical protein